MAEGREQGDTLCPGAFSWVCQHRELGHLGGQGALGQMSPFYCGPWAFCGMENPEFLFFSLQVESVWSHRLGGR